MNAIKYQGQLYSLPLTRSDYRWYITSHVWRRKHTAWLKLAGNRCSALPWVRVGRVEGKYHPYRMNHMHYSNLGQERLFRDVMPLCPWFDKWIYHGICSGFKSAGKQGNFPNLAQRTINNWCRLPIAVKGVILSTAIPTAIAYSVHLFYILISLWTNSLAS